MKQFINDSSIYYYVLNVNPVVKNGVDASGVLAEDRGAIFYYGVKLSEAKSASGRELKNRAFLLGHPRFVLLPF